MSTSQQTDREPLIHAADYVPDPPQEPGPHDVMTSSEADAVLFGLFGDLPDYRDPDMAEVRRRIMNASASDIAAYCREQGVEVCDATGEPIAAFRDIAAMLMALEMGLIERT